MEGARAAGEMDEEPCAGLVRPGLSSDAVSERRFGPKGEIAKDRYKTRAAELVLQVCARLMRQQLCRLPKEVVYPLGRKGRAHHFKKIDLCSDSLNTS